MLDNSQNLDQPEQGENAASEAAAKAAAKKRNKELRQKVEVCKSYRRKLAQAWTTNIDYRRGKPFSSQSDEDRIAVNLDWAMTQSKQAALFSQVPQARVNHPPHTLAPDAAGWVHGFEQKINDTLVQAGIEAAMNEVIPDCVNAAGLGAVIIAYETISEQVEVPGIDLSLFPPEVQAQITKTKMLPNGMPVPFETVPRVLDKRYLINRISPADFLWPINFTGSDFNNAPWIGRSGKISWAEAARRFGLKVYSCPISQNTVIREE